MPWMLLDLQTPQRSVSSPGAGKKESCFLNAEGHLAAPSTIRVLGGQKGVGDITRIPNTSVGV